MTFASSANCIRFCGGNVRFVDIDPETYLLDINKLKEILSTAPKGTYKGMVLVDFAGYPHNMEEYRKVADEYGMWILEDACHAPGAYFIDSTGERVYCGCGKYSDITVFSFHPVKHITTGEGGMACTQNKEYLREYPVLTEKVIEAKSVFHLNDIKVVSMINISGLVWGFDF